MRRPFPQRLRRRALIESVFSSLRRRVLAREPDGILLMQMRLSRLLASILLQLAEPLISRRTRY
jgi:hypothetical protein